MKDTENKNCKRYLFRCDCESFHFLQISWYSFDDDADLEVGGDIWQPWKDRIKAAWKILRGQHAEYFYLLLNQEKAEEIKRVLELYLADVRTLETGKE